MDTLQEETHTKAEAQQPVPQPIQASDNETNYGKKRTLWWLSGVIIAIGLIWIFLWVFYFRFHESTDDAYANGNLININPAVPGSVVAFFADDTDLVVEGQLLVLLDRTDYQIRYENALASLAQSVLQVRQLFAQVEAQRANMESKHRAFTKAQYDYQNRAQLIGSKAISNEDYVHSMDDLFIAEMNYKQALFQFQAALDAVGNTSLEEHPLIEDQKARVRDAFYSLQHCAVYAPATGYVAQRQVDVGEWVQPTTAMMAVIPKDYVWVDANFKETQLKYMRIGQPASVWLDLYGSSIKYEGKVLGIASGTGSVFSLIPPQNATGNWIKIVQRLPVRISLDPEQVKKFPIRLGLSAEVNVNITEQNLPMLAIVPPTQPVGTTSIFDLRLEQVDKTIDEVIQANLKKDRPKEQETDGIR